jgi:hypothetical protein
MHRALVRNHEYSGSVHALYRFLEREGQSTLQATVMLEFAVGENAQVDFGQSPVITNRRTGELIKRAAAESGACVAGNYDDSFDV